MRGRGRGRGKRERQREREREIQGGVLVSVTVCGLGGQEIKSLDLSHLWVFSKGFFSGRTQGLKIIGEKHAGNYELVNPLHKKAALVPCA